MRSDLILGVETSCDETAAAVLRGSREVLSNVIASQIPVHRRFGGVVPELASRQHILSIDVVIKAALEKAGIELDDLGGIAVTYGPGLVGSLLIGISAAKAIAMARDLPLAAVNHIEGHIRSVEIEHEEIPLPSIVLVVSGGHTSLYLVPEEGTFRPLAHTRDDAAGEAFDKVAKLLGLGYPGGPVIDRLASSGDPKAVRFTRPRMSDGTLDFSFSGMKTAVLRWVRANKIEPVGGSGPGTEPRMANRARTTDLTPADSGGVLVLSAEDTPKSVLDLLASFQEALVSYLIAQTSRAVRSHGARSIAISGGVACNSRLRGALKEEADRLRVPAFYPSPIFTTDNAAMIAAAGYHHLARGRTADLSLNAEPAARL